MIVIITSKYPGRCDICGESYERGDAIWWIKGERAIHAECHNDEVANEKSPIKPVQSGTVVRFNPPKKE